MNSSGGGRSTRYSRFFSPPFSAVSGSQYFNNRQDDRIACTRRDARHSVRRRRLCRLRSDACPTLKKPTRRGRLFPKIPYFGLFAHAQPRRLAQVSISLLLTLLCLRCQGFGGATYGWPPNLSRLPAPGKARSWPRHERHCKGKRPPLNERGPLMI